MSFCSPPQIEIVIKARWIYADFQSGVLVMNNDIFDKYQDLGVSNFGRQRSDFRGPGGVDPKVIGYVLLGLSVFLLTVSISLIGVANPNSVRSMDPSTHDAGTETMLSVDLPFGTRARTTCLSTCPEDPSGDACRGRCNRLVVGEFARRILPVDPDPVQIARETAEKCRAVRPVDKELEPEVWRAEARANVKALRAIRTAEATFDSRVATDRLREVARIRDKNFSSLEKGESEAAKCLAEEVCLREGIFASQIAIVHVANSNDTLSERFYRTFEQVLREDLVRAEEGTGAAFDRVGIRVEE